MRALIGAISPKSKKYILAAMSALIGFGSDVSVQLQNASVNWTRAMIIGVVVGGLVRIVGAVLALEVTEDVVPPKPSIDVGRVQAGE